MGHCPAAPALSAGVTRWGREVRAVPELLSRLAAGWRYEWCSPYEVGEKTGWCQYWLTEPDGTRHPVRTSIAVAAWRKGLAVPVMAK